MHRKDRRLFLLSAGLTSLFGCSFATRPSDRPEAIKRLFTQLHEQHLFNGEVLVAENGRVIYSGAFGLADQAAKLPYTTRTPSCIASLSKPITAVALMMLVEKNQVTLETQLSQLLPGFSHNVGAVTVRQLLAHTSGVPDYPDLGVDHPGVTNAEILAALRQVKDPVFPPGMKYKYSNSGYVLLGQIIESLSGTSLPQFLTARIFQPLGMNSTFVLTSPEDKKTGVARGYERNGSINDFEGIATGESGVYSTVHDLLLFDQALYTDTLLSQETLTVMFTPSSVREGSTTYGLGWNIERDGVGLKVWHQGNTAGFRAFIERRLSRRITVIMLTNGGDTDRMKINKGIQKILG